MQFGSLTRNRSVAKVQRLSHVMIYQQMPYIFNIFGSIYQQIPRIFGNISPNEISPNNILPNISYDISADAQYIWLDRRSKKVVFSPFEANNTCHCLLSCLHFQICWYSYFWPFLYFLVVLSVLAPRHHLKCKKVCFPFCSQQHLSLFSQLQTLRRFIGSIQWRCSWSMQWSSKFMHTWQGKCFHEFGKCRFEVSQMFIISYSKLYFCVTSQVGCPYSKI